jgi:phospholipid/cholesterol/gamma-HCH transport system substrate-binding protein
MRRVPLAPLVKFLAFAAVVTLATTVLGLTIANAQGGARTGYSATFTDASGLLPGDDVRIAGVVVGSVDRVAVVDRRLAKVDFSVDAGQPIPASATAAILYKNLIGQRFLSLGQGAGATGAMLKAGDTIPVAHTTPPLNLTTLFNGFQPLFAALDPQQVNTLSMEIVQVLQGEGGTVESLLASTASLTGAIADRDQVIGQVVDNLNGCSDRQLPLRPALVSDRYAAAARGRARRRPAADRPGDFLDRRPHAGDGRVPGRRSAQPEVRHRRAR